jgi:hypothetical protein
VCEPVTALTAVAGGVKAFGGLRAARDQKDAAARDWEQQMEIRKLNFQRDQGRYSLKLAKQSQELDEYTLAASTAFAREQAWLNDQFNAATVQYQNEFAKAAKGMKFYGSGKTAKRLASLQFAELGRMQAMQVSNLIRAREKVEGFGRDTRRKLQAAQQRAYDAVGQIPVPGIAPPKPDMNMTSAYLNFAGDIAGTAASAYGAFQKSKPPTTPFADTGTPSGFSYGSDTMIDYDIGLKTGDLKFFDY